MKTDFRFASYVMSALAKANHLSEVLELCDDKADVLAALSLFIGMCGAKLDMTGPEMLDVIGPMVHEVHEEFGRIDATKEEGRLIFKNSHEIRVL